VSKVVKYPGLVSEMARRGEDQQTLATLLKTTQASISRKLNGIVDWSFGDIDILCEHYDRDYYYLFK